MPGTRFRCNPANLRALQSKLHAQTRRAGLSLDRCGRFAVSMIGLDVSAFALWRRKPRISPSYGRVEDADTLEPRVVLFKPQH